MSETDIGKLGERIFSSWCTEAGITCNKSEEDKEAWDFILEFDDPRSNPSSTLDEKYPGLKCFVQVKSSNNSTSNKQIRLRNWEKMINNSFPVFIVRIEFDKKDKPKEAYLVHVGEELIEKTLRKLRGIDKDQSFLLRQKKQSYPIKEEFRLSDFSGSSLKELLLKQLGKGINAYVTWKKAYVQKVGYEGGRFDFTFKLEDLYKGNPEEMLIDLSLGKINQLSIDKGKISKKRFGRYNEGEDLGPGKILFNVNPTGKCHLTMVDDKAKNKETLELDYYMPAVVKGLLNEDNFKFIMRDKFLELTYTKQGCNFTFSLPEGDELFDIRDCENLIKCANMIKSAHKSKERIKMKMTGLKNKKKFSYTLDRVSDLGSDFFKDTELLKNALIIGRYFGIDKPQKNLLSHLFGQREKINMIAELFDNKDKVIGLQGVFDQLEEWADKRVIIPLTLACMYGDYRICIGIIVRDKFKVNEVAGANYEYILESKNYELLACDYVLNSDDISDRDFILGVYDTLKEKASNLYDEKIIELGFLE